MTRLDVLKEQLKQLETMHQELVAINEDLTHLLKVTQELSDLEKEVIKHVGF